MSNVISIFAPQDAAGHVAGSAGPAALTSVFATRRRAQGDVFWLKENAEWLGIAASCGLDLPQGSLAPFESFYRGLPDQMRFFPQYYRFLLSLCLDLEDLGLNEGIGESLCHGAAAAGLAEAELSDLQRAEAIRLLARRGGMRADPALNARLHGFINRSETFALPNKKAAYELTHIVFYLSDYGKRDPQIGAEAITSLTYAGLLAYLDQNMDLLAEICAALRFARQNPVPLWEAAVARAHGAFSLRPQAATSAPDMYHPYLVTGWLVALTGRPVFRGAVPPGQIVISGPAASISPLRVLSETLLEMGETRSSDWACMRERVIGLLSVEGRQIVADAERATDYFEGFFHRFARAPEAPVRKRGLM